MTGIDVGSEVLSTVDGVVQINSLDHLAQSVRDPGEGRVESGTHVGVNAGSKQQTQLAESEHSHDGLGVVAPGKSGTLDSGLYIKDLVLVGVDCVV